MTSSTMQMQVLATATRIKLRELNAHEERLRAHYDALLTAADAPSDAGDKEPRSRLETLYNGTKDLKIVQTKLHPNLGEVAALVRFAESDPWSTRQGVAQRQQQLEREIRQRRSLWRHNKLLGALLHESLHDETASGGEIATDAATSGGDKRVAKMTKGETQAQLASYFFSPAPDVDEKTVLAFLETQVFHRRESFSQDKWARVDAALQKMRSELSYMSEHFFTGQRVLAHDVLQAVGLLLRNSASFTDDVVAFLTDVQNNTTTQRELAHVLTIELGNLQDFVWPDDGVRVQFQRGMNGRWRCHLQEDAVTLLLFQYVGMQWGKTMGSHLSYLLRSLEEPMDLSGRMPKDSVAATRRELRGIFTLAALTTEYEVDYDSGRATGKPTLNDASKQDLLRLLCAEARFQRVFLDDEAEETERPSITAVTTDLAFFGPSVSHAAVLACLKFFGVGDTARKIFARYMSVPLVFPGETKPQAMQRGLSVGRAMTMLLSETLLFVMDFAVRASSGVHLFRRHDDIIFYDRKAENVVDAWAVMQQWAAVAGLRFNDEKSGATTLQWSPPSPSPSPVSTIATPASLPTTPIQWGLLELQPDASVRILPDLVDAYANELADRLGVATTVFGWINVYNKYMRFFLRSFGNVSPVFGPSHVQEMTAALQHVHRRVFADTQGDVLAALRNRITRDHRDLVDTELPAAWVQWPLELGGLGLYNPLLAVWSHEASMQAYLKQFHENDEYFPDHDKPREWREPFTTAREKVLTEYQQVQDTVAQDGGRLTVLFQSKKAKELFPFVISDSISDASRGYGTVRWNFHDEHANATAQWRLRTKKEFLGVAAVTSQPLLQQEFTACLMQVEETSPRQPDSGEALSPARTAAEKQLSEAGLGGVAYWQWLALLTSESLMDEFGTVAFFSRELLPAQLIETIKTASVAW